MKKVCIWLLVLLFALPALPVFADDAALPAVGDQSHGFTVTDVTRYELIDADVVTYVHDKTGASVIMLLNEDTNRYFNIGFRTPAVDDKGTTHVFEHATLDGSEKYPSSSLFFDLTSQTYNTYMNALTYSFGFTCYPIASLSEVQLLSLSDFYLDSVFHPMLMEDESIFDEEAWRYAMDSADDDLRIEGTVYSEMSGSYSIGNAHQQNVDRALFPGSFIGNYTGGNPQDIPSLTWQDLTDYHDLYYHPSNSLTMLYGKIENPEGFLAKLDEYFSAYEMREMDFTDADYTPRADSAVVEQAFPVSAGTDTRYGSMITYAFLLENATEEDMEVLDLLTTVLANPASPMMQDCLEKLSTSSVDCYISNSEPDYGIYFNMYNVEKEDADRFAETIRESLQSIVDAGGFETSLIDAVSHEQRMDTLLMTESDDLFSYLNSVIYYGWFLTNDHYSFTTMLENLEKFDDFNQSGAYTDAISRFVLNNDASVLVTTYPQAGLQDELDAALADELAEIKSGLTDEEIQAIVDETKLRSQPNVDSAAAYVSQLQSVTVDTLPEEIREYAITDETDGDNVRRIHTECETEGIGTELLLLNASGISQEDLHWYRMYCALAGSMATEKHTQGEVAELSTRYLYDYSINTAIYEDADGEGSTPYLRISFKVLDEDIDEAYDLLYETLFETDFSDTQKIAESLSGQFSHFKSTFNNSPDTLLYYLPFARVSESSAYANYIQCLDFYSFLEEAIQETVQNPDAVVARLLAIREELANRWGAVSGYAGSRESYQIHTAAADAFLNKLKCEEITPETYEFEQVPMAEAVIVDSNVQYNMAYATYEEIGLDGFTADLDAINQLVNGVFLTPLLREQYGVYGTICEANDEALYLYSYADPNITETFDVYRSLPERLRGYTADQSVFDGYILSRYAYYAKPEGELTGAYTAMVNQISGVGQDVTLAHMRELKSANADDIAAYADTLEALMNNGAIFTVGSAGAIEDNADLYDLVLNPFSAVDLSDVDFADVPEDSPLYDAVWFSFSNRLMGANGPTEFGVNDALTMGEMATSLMLLTGESLSAEDAIAFLQDYGIVPGDATADAEMTREEMGCVMYNFCYAVSMDVSNIPSLPDLPDAGDITGGCEPYLSWILDAGALALRDDGRLAPQEGATRGELALMLIMLFSE